ncbi:beta-ketoacyl-[acyl-carrier-protein] synthase family protein [Fulvivirga ligni]|uniref:beta-ketoacyl-[acyl-carrier-protein] synthase family protein n=1 Tax=Fulvivirga ligni TaxID=2904246 RepID=UPI001F18D521|nr:beta-ketoacyl-[acyl-carrier-protein] synthase family protein [Fulvivirga ligni]UII23386.1 beta-ketoacyl-[acyl-carrier-protein] synthase family protein [Fulvivirga ligni]
MSKRVFVTGMGIISALGNGVLENRNQLEAGATGIKKATILKTRYTDIFPFGEVPLTTDQLLEMGEVIGEKGISRTEALAMVAIRQALKDAGLKQEQVEDYSMSLLSASTVGGMSRTDQLHKDANKLEPASEYLASYNVGEHTSGIAKRLNVKGASTTFNTACSSSANAIMYGAKLIKSGRATRAIAGGTDALAKYTVNGFNSLQILAEELCKPFDKNRVGLNLGEGAAYLILESEDVVGDKKIYGEVSGYGNANDAFHPSSISDEAFGVIAAIEGALETAQIPPEHIDYINTHGTGTPNNDITEQTGMHKVFKGQIPPFQSTKTYTGHTLGAAGAIEAVFSLLALNHNELYTSLNCADPIDDYGVVPINKYQDNYEINHVLSSSFGFGGNCSSLVFSKV